ncbi:hypothetical protein R1sor_000860 [Riccia sorocarpa]|uniref:Retrotransposon gag domain-containing protein n=1 Tax=Riccia sorocarpa TaxID=122646 RepID=A0ABD3GV77_9MARC
MFQKESITERERCYLLRLVKKQEAVIANVSKSEGTSAYFADFSEEENSSFEDQDLVIVANSQQASAVSVNQTPPWLSVHLRNILRRRIRRRTPGPVLAPMAAPITRLRYPSYRGKESEDPDAFIEEFEQTARANREAHNDDKLRIFPALLKGRGSRWVVALDPADLATWNTLKKAYLAEFRSLGFNKTVYNRLATLERKRNESLRMYMQRFRNLVNRLTNTPDTEQQVEWYVNGLPTDLAFQCRLGSQNTMAEVIATAEKYETARRTAKKKKLKSRRTLSSSSEDDSGTLSDSSSEDEETTRRHKSKKKAKRKSSSAEDSSSSEEEEKPKWNTSPRRRSKSDKNSMDALLREMADLKVQIANVKEKRKNPSAARHNLWCSNCHSTGHTKDDCRMGKGSGTQVNWVEESTPSTDESYYAEGSRRSKGETKSVSNKEEKKKKGKKPIKVPSESSSDSDSDPAKLDTYKDDISTLVREALKGQTSGKEDATPSNEKKTEVLQKRKPCLEEYHF